MKTIYLAVFIVAMLVVLPFGALATTDTVGGATGSFTWATTDIRAMPIVASASGILQTVSVNMYDSGGNMVLGIYNSTGGAPDALLAVGTAAAMATGWNDFNLSGSSISIAAGTTYWVSGSISQNQKVYSAYPDLPNAVTTSYGYTGSLPNPFGASVDWINMNMRMTYQPAVVPIYVVTANITYDALMTAYCHSAMACTLLRNGTDVTATENGTATLLHRGGWNYTATNAVPNSTKSWAVVALPSGGLPPLYGIRVKFISEDMQITVR